MASLEDQLNIYFFPRCTDDVLGGENKGNITITTSQPGVEYYPIDQSNYGGNILFYFITKSNEKYLLPTQNFSNKMN